MSTTNIEFERTLATAEWLIELFYNDRQLLREYMGGSRRPMLEAVGQVEKAARELGWSRFEIERALRLLQHS